VAETNGVAEAVEEAAAEKLGIEAWDRPAILREAMCAATENGVPYWSVLALSGAIATLGLAIDSSAVVIGAMLVAPLLAPITGLALSLAVGDARLAVQTAVIVGMSTITVIAVGAVLTLLLPFHTITLEISARTRPTTLDLAIAIFSGLVGAVVTVGRRNRLSAAIPGVAIAVALIPPLAVAGFGLGVWDIDLILGSMLLYGANLAGIVLSGMGVFMLVGMHRADVVTTAHQWHREAAPHGLAGRIDRLGWVRSLSVFRAPAVRIGLVLAFVVALGWPLTETLAQITRETRVERAVAAAERAIFEAPGRASVLGRQVVIGAGATEVYLRVATNEWFEEEERAEFERRASTAAAEPVRLTLDQLPARGTDVDQLASLFPPQAPGPVDRAPALPPELSDLLGAARRRVARLVASVVLPPQVEIAVTEVTIGEGGTGVRVVYTAPAPLPSEAEAMIREQVVRVLDLPGVDISVRHALPGEEELAADTTARS
jgi:uncharacterized hydrophobic protein (TIGR00271 family)